MKISIKLKRKTQMNKTIGTLLLLSWIPFVIAMAFPSIEDGMYMVTGFMWLVFGTWAGILLVRE